MGSLAWHPFYFKDNYEVLAWAAHELKVGQYRDYMAPVQDDTPIQEVFHILKVKKK